MRVRWTHEHAAIRGPAGAGRGPFSFEGLLVDSAGALTEVARAIWNRSEPSDWRCRDAAGSGVGCESCGRRLALRGCRSPRPRSRADGDGCHRRSDASDGSAPCRSPPRGSAGMLDSAGRVVAARGRLRRLSRRSVARALGGGDRRARAGDPSRSRSGSGSMARCGSGAVDRARGKPIISVYVEHRRPRPTARPCRLRGHLPRDRRGSFRSSTGCRSIAAGALRGYKDTLIPMLLAAFGYWGAGFLGGCALRLSAPLPGRSVVRA